MAFSRYDNRTVLFNNNPLYQSLFRERQINFVRHYNTATLKYPTSEEMQTVDTIGHIWKLGDAFWKLSAQYYGDAEMWWVIAFWNLAPTEAHIKPGDTIYIPQPLEKVLKLYGV